MQHPLILRFPLNLGRAYGGYRPYGAAAAAGAWLLLLHVIVLAGYVLTLRLGRPGPGRTTRPADPHTGGTALHPDTG